MSVFQLNYYWSTSIISVHLKDIASMDRSIKLISQFIIAHYVFVARGTHQIMELLIHSWVNEFAAEMVLRGYRNSYT